MADEKIHGRIKYNCFGNEIEDDEIYIRAKDEFFDEDGNPKWSEYIKHGDDDGFDVNNLENNGKYIIKVVLPVGKKIVRYGDPRGSFTTDEGCPYEKISLPYVMESVPYHEYIVIENTVVGCYVDKGKVAPGFDHEGGGVQYKHYFTIHDSLMNGILKEDFSWLEKK